MATSKAPATAPTAAAGASAGAVEKTESGVVVLNYTDLVAGKDMSAAIEVGFGRSGLGLLVVRGIPEYDRLRKVFLPLARTFSKLPEDVKNKYVDEASHYSYGWSYGKEYLSPGVAGISISIYHIHDSTIFLLLLLLCQILIRDLTTITHRWMFPQQTQNSSRNSQIHVPLTYGLVRCN